MLCMSNMGSKTCTQAPSPLHHACIHHDPLAVGGIETLICFDPFDQGPIDHDPACVAIYLQREVAVICTVVQGMNFLSFQSACRLPNIEVEQRVKLACN